MFLFSKKDCFNCEVVKKILSNNNVNYESKTVSSLWDVVKLHPEVENENITTFPILVDKSWIGDFQRILYKYDEDILKPTLSRFTLYPVQYTDLFNMYKKASRSFWQPEEVDLSKDKDHWDNILTISEKHFVGMILSFFAGADGIVNENLSLNFSSEVTVPEARAFYGIQEGMEVIHNDMYGLLLDRYISDPIEKIKLQQGMEHFDCIKQKANWALTWTCPDLPFCLRLIAFACVEGIFFSGSFCAIFWLKKRNLLPGLSFSNELISRDEALHTEFATMLFSHLKHKPQVSDVHKIVKEAVTCEQKFITQSLPCALIGMNAKLMSSYIEFVADRLVTQLGYEKIFNAKNPFDFMENISLTGKTNFFEKRVGEYSKQHGSEPMMFSLDEQF